MNTTTHPNLYKTHLDHLKTSAITEASAEAAGLVSISAADLSVRLNKLTESDAIQFQYHTLDGSKLPSVRYAKQFSEGVEEGKVLVTGVEMVGTTTHPYLPLGLAQVMKRSSFLIVTTSELAAVAGVAHGLACVAVHACDAWMDPDQLGLKVSPDTIVHPMILDLAKKMGRVLVLGSSETGNPRSATPEHAEQLKALAGAIRSQCDDVVAAYTCCKAPAALKAYKGPKNVTLDAWLAYQALSCQDPAKEIIDLLGWHIARQVRAQKAQGTGGYVALGVMGGSVYVAWSNRRNVIDYIPKKDILNTAVLISLATLEWCEATYPKTNAKGQDVGVDYTAMAGQLLTACESPDLPPFSKKRVVKGGVYLADDDPEVLVVNGRDIFRSDGQPIDRATGRRIYTRSYDLGITSSTQQATTQQALSLLDAAHTWAWRRKSDAKLWMGAIMAAFASGAHRWRVHTFIHGKAGSGKSHLQKFGAAILGEAGSYTTNSSGAGVKMALDENAIACLCDEQGAGAKKLGDLMVFLKAASGGGFQEMGSPNDGAKRYQLSTTGFVSGADLPQMDDQEESRFLIVALNRIHELSKNNPHPLISSNEDDTFPEVRILGEKMFARMIYSWPRFLRALKLIKSTMKADARTRDTLSLPLAGAWIAFHDEELMDAESFIAEFDIEQDIERIRAATENDDFQTHLLSSKIAAGVSGVGLLSVSEVCSRAYAEIGPSGRSNGPYTVALRMGGMRVRRIGNTDKAEVLVSPREEGFKALFKDTKVFSGANLSEQIRRIPGASQKLSESKERFSSKPERYLTFPLDMD